MVRLLLTLVVLFAAGASFAQGEDKPPEDSIQVEVRGTLETGIVAIGGETTGTIIKVGNVTWELDLSGDPKLAEAAKKLNKQKVVVAGTYQKKQGVEVAERHIVTVKSLQAADAK